MVVQALTRGCGQTYRWEGIKKVHKSVGSRETKEDAGHEEWALSYTSANEYWEDGDTQSEEDLDCWRSD